MVSGQSPHAGAFPTKDKDRGSGQVHIEEAGRSMFVRADDAHTYGLYCSQEASEVADLGQRLHFSRAAGNLAHHRRETHVATPCRRDKIGPGSIGRTEYGTEIARILHSVQHQYQRVIDTPEMLASFTFREGSRPVDTSGYALMLFSTSHLPQLGG